MILDLMEVVFIKTNNNLQDLLFSAITVHKQHIACDFQSGPSY